MITKHPDQNGPITQAEGSNVVLRCEAKGTGPLTYQWMRKSGSLPKNIRINNEGQKLTIRNITISDGGEYYCKVDNGGDSVSSMQVQVIVRSKFAQ